MTDDAVTLERDGLDALIGALRDDGYIVIGPTVHDRAIVHGELRSSDDLPVGWTDEQDGGTYRLTRRDDEACFGYNLGPRSWKEFRLPPVVPLVRATREGDCDAAAFEQQPETPTRYAFLGVRSCELHAMGVLDRVLLGGEHPDPRERTRLEDPFIVAVQCGQAGGTCFCVSMGTGPRAEAGFDLSLTEVLDEDGHRFVVAPGSARGGAIVARLPTRGAEPGDLAGAARATERAVAQQGRTLDTTDIRDLLQRNLEHPRWDEVADRCLSCGNCTMVCPTCFCTSVEDTTDLAGESAERVQRWASCFTVDYSHIHGGSIRRTTKARYRQWMTHKLSTWFDQFGSSGCVGCGRCITWCPVAIDITEEAAAIRATDGARADG